MVLPVLQIQGYSALAFHLGVAAICLLTINVIWTLYDPGVGIIIYLGAPYMVFEFLIGPWLMIAGVREDADLSWEAAKSPGNAPRGELVAG